MSKDSASNDKSSVGFVSIYTAVQEDSAQKIKQQSQCSVRRYRTNDANVYSMPKVWLPEGAAQ